LSKNSENSKLLWSDILKGLKLKLNKVKTGDLIDVRIYPLDDQVSELRQWREGTLVEVLHVKNSDIEGVHF